MKVREEFEDAITAAAADYSYMTGDDNFECMVKVTCENGWVKATLISQEEGGEE